MQLSYPRPDDPYLLLHNTAYDRYLGVTFKPSPLGHHGCRTEQHDCDDEGDLMAVMWWASGPGFRGVVLLRSVTGRFLCAKGTTKNKVELEDPVENIGAKLVRQAATKTNDLAGDGTTTFVILAQGMIVEGVKIVAAGANTVQIARGIEKTTKALVGKEKTRYCARPSLYRERTFVLRLSEVLPAVFDRQWCFATGTV
ncbi:hypothetical protein ZWY2020_013138 [Hordeum vulgare]|nr:hypothetical protein ZWY2020_013138 [Hordeum vulgare]